MVKSIHQDVFEEFLCIFVQNHPKSDQKLLQFTELKCVEILNYKAYNVLWE